MTTIDNASRLSRLRRSQAKDAFRSMEDAENFQKSAAISDGIRRQMSDANEDLYDVYIQLTIMSESLKELNKRKREIKQKLRSRDIYTDECLMYQEQAFLMSLPLLDIQKSLFVKAKRNFLTSTLASTYMYTAFSLYSEQGICLGIEGFQHSLVVYDPFDKSRFSNGNCVIAGTPGMGKTFLLMSMAYAFRLKGLPVFAILPEKGHEWKRVLVPAIGGQYIELAPGSKDCINILAIKPPKKGAIVDEEESNASLLSKKIHQIITFIQLNMQKDRMDDDEEAAISTVLTKMYEYFGITTDNDSIYVDKDKGILKPMPIMEDFYYQAQQNEVLSRRICQIINIYVNGDAKNMNGQTNVDLSNPFTVISLSLAGKRMLAPFSFLAIDYCYDTIKADMTENCVLMMDEVWKMMANRYASEYVDEIYRICRGYGCAAVSATQKCDDLFNNEYGTSIMDNARIKFILGMEKKQADALEELIYLTHNDKRMITSQGQGQAMLFANNDKLQILIHSPAEWGPLFETDSRKLKRLLEEGRFDENYKYIRN